MNYSQDELDTMIQLLVYDGDFLNGSVVETIKKCISKHDIRIMFEANAEGGYIVTSSYYNPTVNYRYFRVSNASFKYALYKSIIDCLQNMEELKKESCPIIT